MRTLVALLTGMCVCFFADCMVIVHTGNSLLHSVFIFCLTLLLYERYWPLFGLSILFLGIESFLLYDLFGINYCYLFPLFGAAHLATFYLSSRSLGIPIGFVSMLLMEFLFLSFFGFKQRALSMYTFYEFAVIMGAVYFSLKWLPTAKQGNRF